MTESDDKTKNLKSFIVERQPDEKLWQVVQFQAKGSDEERLRALETIVSRLRELPEDADQLLIDMSKNGSLVLKKRLATLLTAKPTIPYGLWSNTLENLAKENDAQVQETVAPLLQPYKKLAESIRLQQERILDAIPKGLLADIAQHQAMMAKVLPNAEEMRRLTETFSKFKIPINEIQKSIDMFRQIRLPAIQLSKSALDSISAFSSYQNSMYANLVRISPSYYPPEETIHTPKTEEHSFITKLRGVKPGRKTWSEYQRLCGEILTFCLVPPLLDPVYEESIESGIHRRDMIYHIPYDGSGFWGYMRTAYNALAIIVDAKNYSGILPKDQVVITSKYFGKKKLGSLGIIVTRQSLDKSGKEQQADRWIHHDEMIVCLTDVDLEEMIRLKLGQRDPEIVIDRKIREFRSSL